VPLELLQVPAAPYVVDIVPVQLALGGVSHVKPPHGSTHAPLVQT
jgi:hypothetical protein